LSSKDRLERLRDLVARLEQLPGSAERDRMLAEVRGRAVDLETGVTPRAMLQIDEQRLIRDDEPVPAKVRAAPAPQPSRVVPAAPREPRVPRPMSVSIDLLATDERLSLEDPSAPHRAWQHGLRG
jgi:hypothetical protein